MTFCVCEKYHFLGTGPLLPVELLLPLLLLELVSVVLEVGYGGLSNFILNKSASSSSELVGGGGVIRPPPIISGSPIPGNSDSSYSGIIPT